MLAVAIGAYMLLKPSISVFTEDRAIDAVIAQYPELAAYKTTSLPPSSIETKKGTDGWSVAFVQRGSGMPGILEARCYRVRTDGTVAATGHYARNENIEVDTIKLEDCTPETIPPSPIHVLPFGNVTLNIGATAQFKDISIKPISIEEDSRCPTGAQCVWAGRVRIKIQVVSGTGASTSIVTLGEVFMTGGKRITLSAVTPEKRQQVQISASDYRLTFIVVPQTTPIPRDPLGKCYVGGCSAQLCTDQADSVSTCEYSASYACYKTATCERQVNGKCGWTQTQELAACIARS